MNKKYIIKFAPLFPLPIMRTQVFSYLFHEPIKKGSLVEVPFYNRLIPGIVMDSRNDFPRYGNYELKNLKKVIAEEILSEKQIELAKKLADFYLSPLGIALKLMTPKISKARKHKIIPNSKLKTLQSNRLADEIMKSKEREIALVGPKGKRDEIIFSAISAVAKRNKQCLFLMPEIFPAIFLFERLKPFFPNEELVLVHGGVSKGEIFETWSKIKSGKVKIIVE